MGQPTANDVHPHPLDVHSGPRQSGDTLSADEALQQVAADAAHKADIEIQDPTSTTDGAPQ